MPRDGIIEDADDYNQANTLATLPSYVGKTKVGIEILSFPFSRHLTLEAKDTLNLQAILVAPVNRYIAFDGFFKSKT